MFLGFIVQRRHKITTQEEHPIHHWHSPCHIVTSFSVNYNKTDKSRLEYENNYDLLKLHTQTLKFELWAFSFLNLKT